MSGRKGFSINGAPSSTDTRGQQSVASSALRKAGLAGMVDGDTGMREMSSAGPSRSRSERGASSSSSRRGAGASGGGSGSSRMRIDPIPGNAPRARDRANPMGGRPPSGPSSMLTDRAKGKGKQQGSGRVPGGGGGSSNPLGTDTREFTASKAIAAIKRFFAPRWNAEAKFLNLEAMHADPILKEENIPAPGQSGSPTQLTSVMWKLAGELYPDITTLSVANNNFKTIGPLHTLPDYLPKLQNLSLEGNQLQWTKDLTGLAQRSSKGKHRQKATSRSGPSDPNDAAAEALSRLRLPALQELILNGNPVYETAISVGNEDGYRQEILARFPTLRMLDRKPVSQVEADFAKLPSAAGGAGAAGGLGSAGLAAAAQAITGNSKMRKAAVAATQAAAGAGVEPKNFPVEMKEGFVDPAAQGIVPDFLSKYFSMFDNSRKDLVLAYAPSARISASTNFVVPPRAKVEGWQMSKEMPNQQKLPRDLLGKKMTDRNLYRRGSKIPSLYSGHKEILEILTKLPQTTHPLQDASRFVFDAWVLPNPGILDAMVGTSDPATSGRSVAMQGEKPEAVLWIQVHGQFAEAPSQGVRSFDRIFVVAPVTPGSAAANAGWPCVILNDMITYRQFSHPKAWASNAIPVGDGSAALAATAAAPMGSYEQHASASAAGTSSSAQQGAAAGAQPIPNGVAPAINLAALPPHLQSQAPAPGLLAAETRLTYPFAVQCLQENGWDPALAMGNFQALKAAGAIPPEA
ncbi:nuclear mRNA export, poly(A)+RNA binding protein, partial [Tilletia horrida]